MLSHSTPAPLLVALSKVLETLCQLPLLLTLTTASFPQLSRSALLTLFALLYPRYLLPPRLFEMPIWQRLHILQHHPRPALEDLLGNLPILPLTPPPEALPCQHQLRPFGLPPSTATLAPYTPLSYVPETPAPAPTAIHKTASPPPPAKVYPFLEKVEVADPAIQPTLTGIVPEEWAAFTKQVLNYNLSLDLYKSDLDWKKDHMMEPLQPDALAEYHLHIGRANQRVGADALMERVISQYIRTIGAELVLQQAQLHDLKLTASDIEWHLAQSAKNTEQLLLDENVPQEDLALALFLPPLQATPSPAAPPDLPHDTPMSSLTSLPSSKQVASPAISELATPLVQSFEQMSDSQPTPKVAPMDISPPAILPKVPPINPPPLTPSLIQ